jgi:protein TonB
MFEDSLLESGNRFGQGRRGATTMLATVLHIVALGILILIPLIYTEALPKQQLMTFLVAPPPPPPPPPPPAAAAPIRAMKPVSEMVNGQLRTPTRIPEKVQMIKEEEPPPVVSSASGVVGGIPGGVPGGQMGGVIGGIISSTKVAVPVAVVPQRVRVSQGVSEGLLLHKVTPTYPPLARQARIQGSVVLQAVISKNGVIENLHLVQGHPMLAPAAIEAVKQWKYKPYFLNGEPVEVETVITVNFTLAGS